MDDPKKNEPDPSLAGFPGSTNEPVAAEKAADKSADKSADKPADKSAEDNGNDYALPPKAELEGMTRAELDAYADEREVDTAGCSTKADVIDALQKDYRKKKRAAAKED